MVMGAVGAGPSLARWTFNYRDLQRDARRMFGPRMITLSRDVSKNTAYDYARATAKIAQNIVASELSDSGRLAASIGWYEPGYLKRPSSGSTPKDAFWVASTKGNVYFVEYGTNVPYAVPVFLGFTVSDERVIYIPSSGRFITVKPFTFGGINALDRAHVQFQADSKRRRQIFEDNFAVLKAEWDGRVVARALSRARKS